MSWNCNRSCLVVYMKLKFWAHSSSGLIEKWQNSYKMCATNQNLVDSTTKLYKLIKLNTHITIQIQYYNTVCLPLEKEKKINAIKYNSYTRPDFLLH